MSLYKIQCLSFLLILCINFPNNLFGQDCDGAEIFTRESFLFGRFEVSMQSAPGDGIISSFFLFNNSSGCNYPEENNEIDVEMTGDKNNIYFTTHHPGNPNPWYYGDNFDLGFNPHEGMHEYAIEWEPGVVRWFVDDELIYVQDEPEAEDLIYPMAIFMNIWATGAVDWAGEWDPSVMPRQSIYDWVRYYEYVPGSGDYGTNNNFKLEWQDDFSSFNEDRWTTSDFTSFNLNYCTYNSSNVEMENGFLTLTIAEPNVNVTPIPVTFSVNTMDLAMNSTDKIYLNGTFNNWCGNCNPMTKKSDGWELTIDIVPGRHEFLFTMNGWDVVGGVPLNSECDFLPCDEFANYGFVLPLGQDQLILDTYCWASCESCALTSSTKEYSSTDKKLLKIFNLEGRETAPVPNQLLFYLYSDGSVEKKIIWDF